MDITNRGEDAHSDAGYELDSHANMMLAGEKNMCVQRQWIEC